MGTPHPLPKRGPSPQILGPCLLWSNGWMDEAGTWHGGRPQPRRLCVRWGPSTPPPKGVEPPSLIFGPFPLWPNGRMRQDPTWYGCRPQPRGLVLDGKPITRKRSPRIFGTCLLWPNGWMDQDVTWYGGRHRPTRQCSMWTALPPEKRAHPLPPKFWPMSIVAK